MNHNFLKVDEEGTLMKQWYEQDIDRNEDKDQINSYQIYSDDQNYFDNKQDAGYFEDDDYVNSYQHYYEDDDDDDDDNQDYIKARNNDGDSGCDYDDNNRGDYGDNNQTQQDGSVCLYGVIILVIIAVIAIQSTTVLAILVIIGAAVCDNHICFLMIAVILPTIYYFYL